jgi:TonB-dependent starch-binding outer membrane protein SusC
MKKMLKKYLFLLLLLPASVLAQSTLTGIVVDKTLGQPLPGVNVTVQGTTNGVSTGFDGGFSLTKLKSGDVINFTYLGFRNYSLTYTGQKTVTVSMEDEAAKLNEVVVVGYGSVKKKDATGSVTSLSTKDFVKGPLVAVDQMVQGKVAGLQITNGGGAPGEGSTIRIRSGSSLNANNDPLIVIDGLPVDGGASGGRNFLSTINQNNIENVTVLKDASATAIYGSRASNGVIIITTKKGKAGDLKVSYNGNVSYSVVGKKVDNLSAAEFRDYVVQNGTFKPLIIDNPATAVDERFVHQVLLGNSNTDWQSEIFRASIGTDHNVSFSGGVDNITYRASVGLTDMDGILKRDNFFRTTLGVSLVGKFLDNHLKIELNNNTSSIRNNYSNRGAIGAAISFDPTQNVKNSDGKFFQWGNVLSGRNPVAEIEQNNNLGTQFRSVGNIQTEYKLHFFPEVKLVANLGYDEISGRSYGDTSLEYNYLQAGNNYDNKNVFNNKLMDLFVNYNKDFKSINTNVDFTAGYSYQDFRFSNENNDFNFANDELKTLRGNGRRNLQSLFGRANFNFADKYLLTLSYRRDGSSRFTEKNRWSNFPAAALAWKINEESFLKNVKVLSNLKLRFGWGITGQQDIGENYPSIPLYLGSDQNSQYQFGNEYYTTFRPEQYNSNLKWEQTETRNIGIDFGFFNNRFTGTVDVYEKNTKDLLAFIPNPGFFGFSNADFYNVGKMKNQGLEVSAEIIPVKNDDVQFAIGGNITFQNSKVEDLFLDPRFFDGISVGGISGGIGNNIQNHQVGYAPNSFYVFEQAYGVDGKPLDGRFIDRNNDGKVDDKDKYRYKKPASDIFYGFYTNLTYKKWDMSMSWRGSWGNYIYNNVDSQYGWKNQVLIRETDLSNGVSNLLETKFESTDIKRYLSDYYIQDASFIRLDNLTLGYNFENFLNSKVDAKLSIGGQNLLLFSKYKGIDPEISGGIDNNLYPRPKVYTLGLNINF